MVRFEVEKKDDSQGKPSKQHYGNKKSQQATPKIFLQLTVNLKIVKFPLLLVAIIVCSIVDKFPNLSAGVWLLAPTR